jgi:hypothetical protein
MASSTSVDGTWSGSFVRTNPDGTTSHTQVVVKLEPRGSDLTGTIGGNIDSQARSSTVTSPEQPLPFT